jgi:hypothetical protein
MNETTKQSHPGTDLDWSTGAARRKKREYLIDLIT